MSREIQVVLYPPGIEVSTQIPGHTPAVLLGPVWPWNLDWRVEWKRRPRGHWGFVSPRDPLCASALRGRARAETLHSRRVRGGSARGRNGATFGFGVMPSFRACGARPSAGWTIQGEMALRGKTGITRSVVFSEILETVAFCVEIRFWVRIGGISRWEVFGKEEIPHGWNW